MSDEAFEVRGHWWLPGREDKEVPGYLRFDPETGGTLTLIGALSVWTDYAEPEVSENGAVSQSLTLDVQERSGTYPRIYGRVEGRPLTLEDCFQTHVRGNLFGPANEQIVSVNRVFKDVWWEKDEEPEADAISVALAYLNDWVIEKYIGETMYTTEDQKRWNKIELSVENKPTRNVPLAGGLTLSLPYRFGATGRRETERSLWQGYRLRIGADSVMPIDDLIDIASDAQDLLSIATGRDAGFQNVSGYHPDLVRERPNGDDIPMPFEVISRWSIRDLAKKPDQIDHHDLYFTFEDLGGVDGLAKWMTVAATYRSALGRAMSTRATANMFVSDRMLNYTAALEGFDRTKTGNSTDKLPTRLQRCGAQAGSPFTEMVGNVNKWSNAVAYHRNDIAHHLGRRPRGAESDQYYLGQSVYWAFVLLMLHEAGAPQAVFDRIAQHQTFVYLNPKVKAVVDAHT